MNSALVIGPNVFRDEEGDPTTVTVVRYFATLKEHFLQQLIQKGIKQQDVLFQQDLATPPHPPTLHTQVLRRMSSSTPSSESE